MIGQIIKIDVLGLGIGPNSGEPMATLKNVHVGKQTTKWDSGGGKSRASARVSEGKHSEESQKRYLLLVCYLPSPDWVGMGAKDTGSG